MSFRRKVRSSNCPFVKLSVRQNVRSTKCPSAKCPFGKMSFGKMSFGKVSFGKMSGHHNNTAECFIFLKYVTKTKYMHKHCNKVIRSKAKILTKFVNNRIVLKMSKKHQQMRCYSFNNNAFAKIFLHKTAFRKESSL